MKMLWKFFSQEHNFDVFTTIARDNDITEAPQISLKLRGKAACLE